MLRLSRSILYVCFGAGIVGLFLTEGAISPVFAQPQRPATTRAAQIDTSIIAGFVDYRQRANVDRRGVRYYPARGLYGVVVRSGNSLALPLIIKGPRRNKVGLWPVPLPNRHGAGIRAVNLSSGQRRVYLKPEVWYTL